MELRTNIMGPQRHSSLINPRHQSFCL
jgi:hypothetical protein